MQKNKNKIINSAIILLNIFLVASLVLVLILENNYGYAIYWIANPFLTVLVLYKVQKWSIRGLNVDTKESKVIQRSFDDSTAVSIIFYAFIYLIIQGIDMVKDGFRNNQIVIIAFFIVTILYELFIFLPIYVAKRDTAKLLEKKYNNQK